MNKIIIHIIAIFLFLCGLILLHVIYNNSDIYIRLFGKHLHRSLVFDIGILCICLSFFIEFYMSFKPTKIIKEK